MILCDLCFHPVFVKAFKHSSLLLRKRPRLTLENRSEMPLWQSPPTSTMPSAKQLKMPVSLPASTSWGSSMNRKYQPTCSMFEPLTDLHWYWHVGSSLFNPVILRCGLPLQDCRCHRLWSWQARGREEHLGVWSGWRNFWCIYPDNWQRSLWSHCN